LATLTFLKITRHYLSSDIIVVKRLSQNLHVFPSKIPLTNNNGFFSLSNDKYEIWRMFHVWQSPSAPQANPSRSRKHGRKAQVRPSRNRTISVPIAISLKPVVMASAYLQQTDHRIAKQRPRSLLALRFAQWR
jgi:hypothetical protein